MAVSEKELSMQRMIDGEFQHSVLEKLTRLEAKMDMLAGNGQPGRVKIAEDRIAHLERSDIRRGALERLVNAAITVAISSGITLHRLWWK